MEDQGQYTRRRRVPRREFIRPVGVLVGGRYYVTRALQIGEGGLKLEFHRPLEVNSQLALSFLIPGQKMTVVRSVVRNQEPAPGEPGLLHFGVEFLNLDFALKRAIRNYVALTKRPTYGLAEPHG